MAKCKEHNVILVHLNNHLLSTVYSVIPLLFHCSVCLFLAQRQADFNYYGSIMTSDCWEGKLPILIFCRSVLSVINPLLFHENFRNALSFPWEIMQAFWFYFLWIYRLICQESIYLQGFIFFTLCDISLKLFRSYCLILCLLIELIHVSLQRSEHIFC